jgi:hypothetical protein
MRRGRRLMQLLEESFAPSMEQWVLWCDYVEEQRRAWTGFAGCGGDGGDLTKEQRGLANGSRLGG